MFTVFVKIIGTDIETILGFPDIEYATKILCTRLCLDSGIHVHEL